MGSLPLRAKLLRLIGRQTWIPRGQDRILRALWRPYFGKSIPFVVDFFGFRYPGDLRQGIDWSVFACGSSAPAELSLLAAVCAELRKHKSRVVFFDVGANVGHHSLFMAAQADEVIAFEPFSPLIEKIQEKIEINRLTNLRVVPVGLADVNATLKYYPGHESNPGMGSFLSEEVKQQRNYEGVDLQVRRGDEISAEMALPAMDILKIDVEGFEAGVLRGFRGRIQRDRPAVLMEMTNLSRKGFGSDDAFRGCFWEGAAFAGVVNGPRRQFRLVPFAFSGPGAPGEILVVPPELADFVVQRLPSSSRR
jgi:FkbM family methyltransferase